MIGERRKAVEDVVRAIEHAKKVGLRVLVKEGDLYEEFYEVAFYSYDEDSDVLELMFGKE